MDRKEMQSKVNEVLALMAVTNDRTRETLLGLLLSFVDRRDLAKSFQDKFEIAFSDDDRAKLSRCETIDGMYELVGRYLTKAGRLVDEGSARSEQIRKEVIRVVADQLCVGEENVRPESVLRDDLNADSLQLVELLLAMEERFNIDIPDEDTKEWNTVRDVAFSIERVLAD